jgi:phytanoyl-CoA hydroxylase
MNSRTQNFDDSGYVALRAFLAPEELAGLRSELDRYIREIAPHAPPTDIFYEDRRNPATLKQMTRMFEHDAWFAGLLERGPFPALAAELLGTPAVPKNLQYFNKPPGLGASTPTPPHQDGFYFMLEPNHALTFWLALDPVDEANGCVRYIPGSHRLGMRAHARTGVLGFSQGIADYGDGDRASEIPMPAAPGDLLAHHSLTIHSAGANRSTVPRRSLGFIYYSSEAREDTAGHAAYQQALAESLRRQGRI